MPLFRFVAVGIAKTLTKVFGLATVTFFGRMPSRDDGRIALIGIVALAWFPVAVATVVPQWTEAIIPFAPEDERTTRWIAVGLTVTAPLAIGAAIARMHNHAGEGWRGSLRHTVAGYYYTITIGFTVAAIVAVVPLVKASYLVRRFDVHRLMVMVPAGTHDQLRDHIVQCLEDHDVEVAIARTNPVVGWLFRRLAHVLGRIFDRPVADTMTVLRGRDGDGEWFEVNLHAADITILGRARIASWIHATLADGLDERLVYFTWDDDSQAVEERARECRDRLEDGQEVDQEELDDLVTDLARLRLDQEAWNAVRRCLYRLERDAARQRADRAEQDARSAPHQP